MALLRYVDDAGQIQARTLDTEQFVIGRAAGCNIVLDDDMISREHLRIDVEADGRFRIRDLGSRNRSYVNGELITEALLTAGDVIRAGDRVLEFIDDGAGLDERIDLEFLTPDRTEPPNCEWVKLKAPVSLTIAQIEQLAGLSGEQSLMARPEDIANATLGQVLLDLQGERGLIALRGDEKTELRPLAHRALRRPIGGSMMPVSQSFALAPLLQGVAGRYPQTAAQMNPKLGYAATAVVAPLTYRGEAIGVLYVDRPAAKKPFPSAAMQYCLASGAQLGAMIAESSRKLGRTAAREGVAWLTMLKKLQASLATPPSQSDTFDSATRLFAGRARCGDLSDFVSLDEQRCYGFVADGGGRGITGLVQASALRAGLRAALSIAPDSLLDPSPLFNEMNRMVAGSSTRQIVPCTYVGLDTAAGKMVYINAGGMPPLLMVAPGRLVTLDAPSLVLGVDAEYHYEPTRVDLPESFRLVCNTDGFIEAVSVAGEALGDRRLHEVLLERDAFAPAADLLAKLAKAYSSHLAGAQPDDDATVMVISRG